MGDGPIARGFPMSGHRREGRISPIVTNESGATAVEYGLILALIFLAVMGGVALLGDSVKGRWNDIADKVTSI
jgi:pilus assembly protein Flp/PilA